MQTKKKEERARRTFESKAFSLYVSTHKKERKKESAGCELVTNGSVWNLPLVPRARHKSVVNLGYSPHTR